MKKEEPQEYPYIVWHNVREIHSGHGTNFWHEATGTFDVAYIEAYGKPTPEGAIHVDIITRRPKRFDTLPRSAASREPSDIRPTWQEIVREVRAAVIEYVKQPNFAPEFRFGRVEVSIGG